jgi:hypothetical protein
VGPGDVRVVRGRAVSVTILSFEIGVGPA